MIEGVVNATFEPVVPLAVQGPSGQAQDIEAVVDTGFSEFLTLPSALVTELRLPSVTTASAILADGSAATFDVYSVTVLWDGHQRRVEAYMSDATPLVGMRLLDRHNLNIDVEEGGRMVIQDRE